MVCRNVWKVQQVKNVGQKWCCTALPGLKKNLQEVENVVYKYIKQKMNMLQSNVLIKHSSTRNIEFCLNLSGNLTKDSTHITYGFLVLIQSYTIWINMYNSTVLPPVVEPDQNPNFVAEWLRALCLRVQGQHSKQVHSITLKEYRMQRDWQKGEGGRFGWTDSEGDSKNIKLLSHEFLIWKNT